MPPEQLNEQELQFKKRARRRLVGAIALVILMITILPMVLDDKVSKTAVPEIEISIPSQNDVKSSDEFTSKVVVAPIELSNEFLPNSEQQVKADPLQADAIVDESVVNQMTSKPDANKSETIISSKEKNREKDKAEFDKKVSSVATPNENKTNSENDPIKTTGNYMVQIGVFSNEENVRQLQLKLKDAGYQGTTEKIVTAKGEKIRLRAGPFSDKSKAEQALNKIVSVGLTGLVVSQ